MLGILWILPGCYSGLHESDQAAVLGDANRGRLLHGMAPQIEGGGAEDERCRAYDASGEFLAVLRREGERWRLP